MMRVLALMSVMCLLGIVGFNAPGLEGVTAEQGDPPQDGEGIADAVDINAADFATVDIFIDPKGQPLGAFQFELTVNHGSFMVVGIEGGDHPAFDHGRPPYYDRKAEQQHTDKLIIAEYAKPQLAADDLPTQPTRVVTVHVAILEHAVGPEPQALELTLSAASNADAKRIDAEIRYTIRTPERPE